jgi:hypothetical protein
MGYAQGLDQFSQAQGFVRRSNNCEFVHDAVDQCDYQKRREAGKEVSADSIVMTTWHARESLQEALWFFKICAMPAESSDPADCDRFAVAVGNQDWVTEMKQLVSSIEGDADDEEEPIECDVNDI